MYKKLAYIIWF